MARGLGKVTGVDDVLEHGWADVREYARRIDRAVERLTSDAVTQIVYADPDELDDVAAEWGESDTSSEAADLRTRIAARGASQASRDLAWATRWQIFRHDWEQWLDDVRSTSPGIPASTAWQRQIDYENRVRGFYASFAALGGTHLSEGLPTTLETASGKPESDGRVPWAGLIVVGSLVAAAVFSQSIVKLVRG